MRPRRSRSVRCAAVIAACVAGPRLDAAPQAPEAPAVLTDVVRVARVQRRVRVIGSLRAAATARLAALEEGPIVEVAVKEAETVERGALLARTDTRRLAAERRQQEARIAEARATIAGRAAELENLRADLEALEAAAKERAVSQRDLRDARTAIETGTANLRAAEQTLAAMEAALERLQIRIADAEVRAPFDARVIERHAEPGEWLRPGDPLVTLQSIGVIEAWLEVPERHLGDVVADPERIFLDAGAFGGRSVERLRVLPNVDPRTRTFFLIADLADPRGDLAPGLSVVAWIPIGEASEEVLVPKDALVRRESSVYVVRVIPADDGDRAQPVPVRVRFELPRHVAVEGADLADGARVVVEGNERLQPGVAVIAKPTQEPAPLLQDGEDAESSGS